MSSQLPALLRNSHSRLLETTLYFSRQNHISLIHRKIPRLFYPSSEGISKGTSRIDLPATFISVFAIKTRLQFALFNEMTLWRYKRGAGGCGGGGERKYHLKYKMTMNSSLYFTPSAVNKISVICVRVVSLWWNFWGLQLGSNLLHHFSLRIFYNHDNLYAIRYTNFGVFHHLRNATWKFQEQA
jgi:hypothetical protein